MAVVGATESAALVVTFDLFFLNLLKLLERKIPFYDTKLGEKDKYRWDEICNDTKRLRKDDCLENDVWD